MIILGGLVLKYNVRAIIRGLIIVMIGTIGILVHNYTRNSVDYCVNGIGLQRDYYLDDELIENYKQVISKKLGYVKSRDDLKRAYCGMGYLYFFSSNYRESNEYFKKALAIETHVSDELQLMLYMGVSNNYYMLGEVENSQEYYEKAQRFAIDKGNELLLADVYQTRAGLYKNLEEPSFDDFHDMMALKLTSHLYHKRLVFGASCVGGLVLIGSILYYVIVTRNLKKKLESQTQMDVLTETMSYEWLHEEISFVGDSHACCQWMLFDLVSFHKYNQTYGYLEGNYALRKTADLLKNEFKDGWVIRYNGHQFLVIMFNQQESIDKRMKQAIEAFRALQIQFVTELSKGQLLIRASGLCQTLTKDFNLDSCLKELEQRLQYLKHREDGNYIN